MTRLFILLCAGLLPLFAYSATTKLGCMMCHQGTTPHLEKNTSKNQHK